MRGLTGGVWLGVSTLPKSLLGKRFWHLRTVRLAAWLLALVASIGVPAAVRAQQPLTPEEQAAMVLASARRTYQEGNYPAAIDRFKEFIAKYGGHKDAAAARYGLALALVEGPREYQLAIDTLNQVVNVPDFADRATALYYLGLAYRSLGRNELALAVLKPQELPQRQQTSRQRFDQAAQQFAASATAFAARMKATPAAADIKQLPLDSEWYVRAKCDEAEMLLEQGKNVEARAIVDALAQNPILANTRFRETVLYYQGYAAFALKDYLAAGRALGELAPFENPAIGLHARYLLARTHHLADQRPEAAAQYAAVLTTYEEQKKTAPQLLQNALQLKDNLAERQRLESLVRDPAPDYVARASFYWGVLLDEDGKYGEALARFAAFAQLYPKHALLGEAQFRQGICQVQLHQFAEGIKNLQPYADHPQLADQTLLWLGRAAIGNADPANPPAYEQSVRSGLDFLHKAIDKAGARAAADPAAKIRRGDALIELGDGQQLIKMYREAAASYQQAVGEINNPDRADEALARQATALHLATQYPESDVVCQKFVVDFPRSPLLPAVLFRFAENAFMVANAAAVNPNIGNKEVELPRLYGDAIKRYQTLVDKYPEFESVAVAQQGIALSLYRLGKYEEAAAILAAIPESDRSGDLATVPYVLADCLIRTLPADSSDALSAALVMQQLEESVKLLGNFLASEPKSPHVPDALVKLGYCHQQMASIIVEPQQRTAALANARVAYDKILQQYATSPVFPYAVFERAKCMEQSNDLPNAINEFNRFASDPLSKSVVAPLALMRLSTIWRSQKKAPDAAILLGQARSQHEGHLAADPARRGWIPLLQYHHGLAVKESGKLTEARQIFEHITNQFPDRPEAIEAAWRAGQCRKDEALVKLETARKVLDQPAAPNDQRMAANGTRDEAARLLSDAGQYLHDRAEAAGQKAAGSEGHLRLLYESAWCFRLASQAQIDSARLRLELDALAKLQQQAKAETPGQTPPVVRVPEILLSAIPLQVGEQRAQGEYQALIEAGPDSPLALEARLELSELLTQRDQHELAIKLLREAIDKEPPAEMTDRLQLRLANSYLAIDEIPEALRRFELLAKDEKHPLAAEARARAGECYFRQQDWPNAVQRLIPFRDLQPFQNLFGVSDRALLKLGQAQAQLKQWDSSRQTLETLVNRFGQSRWVDEARFGIGWAFQNQNQHDQAVGQYSQVVNRTGAEVAARAQLQIGLCRLDQKKFAEAAPALMAVVSTYNVPDLSAMALFQAAQAYNELKQQPEAKKLLERVAKDHATTRWGELARTQLAESK